MALENADEIQHSLYKDTIKLVFNVPKHLYTIDGVRVDGTTSILNIIAKPVLVGWAVKVTVEYLQRNLQPGLALDEIQIKNLLTDAKGAHRKKSSDAADIGTLVHDWIKAHISKEKPKRPYNEAANRAIDTFLQWEKDKRVKFFESERLVFSKKHKYAGTLDFIAEVDGKMVLGDFKTSTGIWDEYFLQLAAYIQAYREEFPDKEVNSGIIVRIGKDGSLEVKDDEGEYEANRVAFNAALGLYRRMKAMEAKHPYIPKWKK